MALRKRLFLLKAKVFGSLILFGSLAGHLVRVYYFVDYDIDIMRPKMSAYHKERL